MYKIMNNEDIINDDECVICFEDISLNNYILFDCCNKKFHKKCLDKWIKINEKNKNIINRCIYCRQDSKIMDKLIKNNTDNLIIEIPNIILTRNILYDRRVRLKILFFILIISLIVLITTLIIYLLTIDNIH
jgi:hypothetical protein